ncbi:MAG: sensor histidine kinase [Lewinella sp.]|jgi:two-component system phosphate regulon sensor histidine kinase PhoR|uniref:sensor histidine kinase n=1 Tax=Lewinella sp. TaxID=2004506 RepID=UPI003D6B4C1B
MQNAVIRWVVILGAVALVGIIGIQSYWVMTTWDLNEEEFNKKVNLALYHVANQLADINDAELPSRDVVKQRTTNYWIVNMAVEIDAKLLEHLLQSELEERTLNVDFEYAVFDCHTDEMVYGGYCSYTPEGEIKNMDLGDLPKDQEFTYYFGVKFPGRTGFLFDKMQLIIFLSAILLLTVLFFAYAMWVILRQKRLSEMQKDFINNMTHEFKTPLSTIKIAAGVFLNDERVKADTRLHRYATIILEQNQRLNKQVEKVLQLASVEKGNLELKKEKVDLLEILDALLSSTRMRLEEQGGELTADLEDAAGVVLMADRLHLTNILYSLLDNAIKYCQEDPQISVRVIRNNNVIQLAIQDNGIGISPAYQARIFDKFYRIPTGNVHNVKGFGLGLYYVRRICQAHNWTITLDSDVGQGTTVRLNLGQGLKARHQPMPI